MKKMILLGLVMASSASAAMRVECNSMDHKNMMLAEVKSGVWQGNYAMNGELNPGATVRVNQRYLTRNALAFTISIDGKPEKMEVAATTYKPGILKGKMFVNGKALNAICVVQESR